MEESGVQQEHQEVSHLPLADLGAEVLPADQAIIFLSRHGLLW